MLTVIGVLAASQWWMPNVQWLWNQRNPSCNTSQVTSTCQFRARATRKRTKDASRDHARPCPATARSRALGGTARSGLVQWSCTGADVGLCSPFLPEELERPGGLGPCLPLRDKRAGVTP